MRVEKDETAARLARQVSDVLAQLLDNGPECPFGADRFDWSSDVLDELARAVTTLGRVVDRLAGGPDAEQAPGSPIPGPGETAFDTTVRELSTAIVRQRNSLLAEGASRRQHLAGIPSWSTLGAVSPRS